MEQRTQHSFQPGSQKGRPVRPGDTIGIVAPAGPITPEALEAGVARLQSWGYRVAVGESVLNRRGYLAGSDAERAADFNAMWARPDVAGIICARGGYGVMRMLPYVDFDMIRTRPKFFCGFSDITAMHAALEREAGLVTFHGPMATAFGAAEAYNEAGLRRALPADQPLGLLPWPAAQEGDAPPAPPVVIRPGLARGRMAGGNLTLLAALMGTPWEPDFTDRIVLIEEVDEAPYRCDRMLTQLLLGGKLQKAAGILFGDSPTCMNGPADRPVPTLIDVLGDLLAPLGIPVLYGYPCGHAGYRATVPLGVMAELDAGCAALTILETALA